MARPVIAKMPREQDRPASHRGRVSTQAALVAVLLFLLAPSVVWIWRDHSVWPWDQAWYGQVATDLYFTATHSLRAWGATMLYAMNIKPPGAVWMAQFFVPLHVLLGSVENALLLSQIVTQFVLLWTVFKIGETISPSKLVAAAGVLFAGATQAFTGLSHQFLVEPLQACTVAWVVYVAARCREWPSARSLVHLACAALLGVMAKATTPVYCGLFVLYILFVLARRRVKPDFASEWRHWPTRVLTALFVVALPPSAAWYKVNLAAVWRHARASSSGDLALDYGFRAPVAQKLLVWTHLLDQSFLSPWLIWVCAAAVVLGVTFRLASPRKAPRAPVALMVLSAAQIAGLLYVFSVNITVDPRYMYALLVFTAVLLMGFCAQIRSRAVLGALLGGCVLQWGLVNGVALGMHGPLANQFNWLLPPHVERSQYQEMERAVHLTSVGNGINVVGVELPWLNANSADFFASKELLRKGVRSHYTGLGYAEKNPEHALERIEKFKAPYIITLDEPQQMKPPDFLNLAAVPVLRELKRSPRYEPVPFASQLGILIFQRH